MPKGFLDRHLHRSKGGGGGGGQQHESPSRLHHHDSLTSSASGSLKKGSRAWPDDCVGGDQENEGLLSSQSAAAATHSAAAAAAAATQPQYAPHRTRSRDGRPSLTIESDLQELFAKNSKSGRGVSWLVVGVVVVAWVLGACGVSWAWLMVIVGIVWAFVTGVLQRAANDAARYESLRLHRRRALQADETCEWLNLLVNRWWIFSSASIFARVKAVLDPRLAEAKPAFLEAISLKQLTLGERTPVLKSVRAWDVTNTGGPPGFEGSPRGPMNCPDRPPPGLSHAPNHTLALICDLALDSDSFSAVLSTRIGGKGVGMELDVGVEKLALLGRVVVTLTLDMEAPFPHITRIALTFTEKPQVWFSVRILKTVQMMELPVLKTWLHSLVMDALATAWVDPGQLEINIHPSEVLVPETRSGDTLAQGVLTVIIWTQKGSSGVGLDEDKWMVVQVDSQQHVTPVMTSGRWQEACSFLISSSPNNHTLVLKVKIKRLITTTLSQYEIPLVQYALEHYKVAETVLQKKGSKVIGSSIPAVHLRLQYTPLVPVNLELPLHSSLTESQEGAGVLYFVVHGADNIPTSSEFPPSPYCLIFNNRIKVKTTHYVYECGSPRWECGVELLVREVCTVTLAVAVCSMPKTSQSQDAELLGLVVLSLATVELPLVRHQVPLSRSVPTPGADPTSISSPGTLTVSVVFRSVTSVAGCNISSGGDYGGQEKGPSSGSVASNTSQMGSPVPSSGVQRRPSLPLLDDDDGSVCRKRSNTPWYSQASRLLGTTRDGEGGTQDIADILSSGLGLMELTIIRARDLVAKDLNGYSDPYCVVKLNGEVKYRTRVKKKTLNPEWEDTLMTHVPRHPDTLSITLWDHDAFGKDFLGSVSLGEFEVKQMSLSDSALWWPLAGTKSGELEVRLKIISDGCEHQINSTQGPRSEGGGTTMTQVEERTDGEFEAEDDIHNEPEVVTPQSAPPLEDDEVTTSIPRGTSHSVSYSVRDSPALSNGRRASESAVIDSKREPPGDSHTSGTFSGSATPSCSSPVRSSGKSKKSGSRFIAHAFSRARSSRTDTSSEASSSATASPTRTEQQTFSPVPKAIPKIALTEHSEDDYGGSGGGGGRSSPEHQQHTKVKTKKSDSGLRAAVKEKMRRGFAHPLRRFRSEANVNGDAPLCPVVVQSQEQEEETQSINPLRHRHHHPLALALSVGGEPLRVGVGGGEGDASELLDVPLSHTKSQPNLLLMTAGAARLSSSTKVLNSTNSNNSSSSTTTLHGHQRADVFVNVRGVAGRVQGLHIPRSGLQLFLRVRISDEKSGGGGLTSSGGGSGGAKGRSIKTVGRSRLVPACPSPTFDCEWQVESEVSRRAFLVLEVRTGSRELLNSVNVVLGDLFTEPGSEVSVERWVNLQGGATLHLRASHGGEPPQSSRRRSIFRSWSLHRLGKI